MTDTNRADSGAENAKKSVCLHCGKSAIEEDNGAMVCTACGTVKENCVLRSTSPALIGGTKFLPSARRSFPLQNFGRYPQAAHAVASERISPSKLHCIKIMEHLVRVSNMSEELASRSREVLDTVFPKYKYKTQTFKALLAGSCVYYVLKEHRLPVHASEFSRAVGFKTRTFLSVYTNLCKHLRLPNEAFSLEDHVRVILKDLPQGTLEERLKFQEIVRKTVDIMKLAEKCWLTSGRSLTASIIASAYFAWKLLDPANARVPFENFFYMFDFQIGKETVVGRMRELNNLFLKLARHLPYVDKKLLTRKYIIFFVDNILKYADFLLDSYFSTIGVPYKDEGVQGFSDFRHLKPKTVICNHTGNVDDVKDSSYILPDDDDDDLIPEADWNLYIRSEEEVNNIKAYLMKDSVESCDEPDAILPHEICQGETVPCCGKNASLLPHKDEGASMQAKGEKNLIVPDKEDVTLPQEQERKPNISLPCEHESKSDVALNCKEIFDITLEVKKEKLEWMYDIDSN